MNPWIVKTPYRLEKILNKLPKEVGVLLKDLIKDFEREGPFPEDWQIGHLSGEYEGFLKVKLKRNYRVIYRYVSQVITIFIEKIGHRKDVYRGLI